MRQILFSIFALVCLTTSIHGQSGNLPWIEHIESNGFGDQIDALAVDDEGNSYVSGGVLAEVKFGGVTLPYDSVEKCYLAKYSPNGTLLWAKVLASYIQTDQNGFDNAPLVTAMEVGDDGSVYMTVDFWFGTLVVGSDTLRTKWAGFYGSALIKCDGDGNILWKKLFDCISNNYPVVTTQDIDITSNFINIAVQFERELQIGDDTLRSPTGYGYVAGVITFNRTGDLVNTTLLHSTSKYTRITSVAKGIGGGMYISGQYLGSLYVGDDTLTSYLGIRTFIIRRDGDGSLKVLQTFRSAKNLQFTGSASDNAGNLYVTGVYTDSLYIGDQLFSGGSDPRMFFVKLDPGGAIEWVHAATATPATLSWPTNIRLSSEGNIYITGMYERSLLMGSVNLDIKGGRYHDIFFLCYKPDGQLFHVESWGVIDAYDTDPLLALDGDDDVYVTGFFSDRAKIRDTMLTVPEPQGIDPSEDAFIAKVGKILPAGIHKSNESADIIIYPHPAAGTANISLSLQNASPLTISLYSLLGENLMTIYNGYGNRGANIFTADLSKLPAGVYHLRIETLSGVVIRQIVVQ